MTLKIIFGLTDVEDDPCYVYDDNVGRDDTIRYNLYRLAPEIEKTTIEWEITNPSPGVLHLLDCWEQTIRRPHLNMINLVQEKNMFVPNMNNYRFSVQFMNLLPTAPDFYKDLVDEDFKNFVTVDTEFGNIYLWSPGTTEGHDYEQSLEHAYRTNSLDKLEHADNIVIKAKPFFDIQFTLGMYDQGRAAEIDFKRWINEHKEELEKLGYTEDNPKTVIGRLPIAKLVGDAWENYQKLQTYSRICRTSIVKEDQ